MPGPRLRLRGVGLQLLVLRDLRALRLLGLLGLLRLRLRHVLRLGGLLRSYLREQNTPSEAGACACTEGTPCRGC